VFDLGSYVDRECVHIEIIIVHTLKILN
jgi:hypothetical protein